MLQVHEAILNYPSQKAKYGAFFRNVIKKEKEKFRGVEGTKRKRVATDRYACHIDLTKNENSSGGKNSAESNKSEEDENPKKKSKTQDQSKKSEEDENPKKKSKAQDKSKKSEQAENPKKKSKTHKEIQKEQQIESKNQTQAKKGQRVKESTLEKLVNGEDIICGNAFAIFLWYCICAC